MYNKYRVKIVDILGIEHMSILLSDYPTNMKHIRKRTDISIDTFDVNGNIATISFNTNHVVSVTVYEERVN